MPNEGDRMPVIEHDGLGCRYHVERIRDGVRTPVEDMCFVLRPQRDEHARTALSAYADACAKSNPELARDLHEWVRLLNAR